MPAAVSLRHELRMHPRYAIGAPARLMNRANPRDELPVSASSRRGLPLAPGPVATGGDTQHLAQLDDGMVCLLTLHELVAD